MSERRQEVGSDAAAKAAAGDRAAALVIRVWISMIGFTFAFSGAATILMRVFDPGGSIELVIDALMLGAILSLSLFGLGLVAFAIAGIYNSREEARQERYRDF